MIQTDDPPLFRDLMRLKPDALTPNGWAVKAGVSRTVWSDMRRHDNPSRRTLEKLLAAAGSSLAEFEALRIGDTPTPFERIAGGIGDAHGPTWRAAPLPPLPLFELSPGYSYPGDRRVEASLLDLGRVVGQVERPLSLAGDRQAYAVAPTGCGMWPRYRQGRTLLLVPLAQVATGDDVMLKLAGQALVLINELVGQSPASVELRQFNPDVTFAVPSREIETIHKVLGEAI